MKRQGLIPFFITGLPRSRTAWLAAYLSTDGRLCLHEATGWAKGSKDLAGLARQFGGLSDTGLIWFYDRIHALEPSAYWVYVDRAPEYAWKSLCRFMLRRDPGWEPDPAMKANLQARARITREKIRNNPRGVVVSFHDLNDRATMADVWRLCLGTPFDPSRLAAFKRLRIEILEDCLAQDPHPGLLAEMKEITSCLSDGF